MDNNSPSKPKDIGYGPALWEYQRTIDRISFTDGQELDKEFLTKLLEYKDQGYNIQIHTDHERSPQYHREDEYCEYSSYMVISEDNML